MDKQDLAVRGLYYDLGRAKAVPATVSVEGNMVVVRAADDGRLLGDAFRREADVSMRLGDIPRQVALPGGWTFETDDNDGIDRLLTAPIDRLLPWLEGGWHRVLIFTLFVIVALGMGWRFGVPYATQIAVDRTPQSVEDTIANGALNTWDFALFDPTKADEARRDMLLAEFAKLVEIYNERPD
ncbi:MAG: hypothetical protein HRU11_12790, partial [Parvularculaceae bacterium]|nr:hypothetical protein [Parvularculaceae bacterium]